MIRVFFTLKNVYKSGYTAFQCTLVSHIDAQIWTRLLFNILLLCLLCHFFLFTTRFWLKLTFCGTSLSHFFPSLILASNPSFRFPFETKNKNYVMFEAKFWSRDQLSTEWIATLHTQTKQSNTITILFLGNSQLKVWKIHLLLHHIREGI